MLHTLPPATALPRGFVPTVAASLVANAVSTLDHDPQVARHYLERLAAMFADDVGNGFADDVGNGFADDVGNGFADDVGNGFADDGAPAGGPTAKAKPVKGGLAAWQVRNVVQYIDTYLGATIGVDALAEVARLSTGHFCRAFKVTTGETPHAFLIRQRVRRAQTLMLQTDDTLSHIAYACGLTDQAHLTRLFRRVVGATPLIWRRTWQAR
ncbi:AraC family transcriptional regulator [Sphingomonas sp. PP-CC-3A-396]|jgi:AraC-like DNA-binding protein|uniref:helix-turn-helix domain-containing protein n=1 Tax=Sphingomonas sp. PP-CC-3A-396 TaxID=2135655 RepID=UPI0010E438C5|nr:AraC family transcriptional regulator [Sphingomonas sp. PP-CC-3A-396]TCQ03644.1 AraC-like DNA-binding protein [Sphingomonas sp. PP-CC-3A-396]